MDFTLTSSASINAKFSLPYRHCSHPSFFTFNSFSPAKKHRTRTRRLSAKSPNRTRKLFSVTAVFPATKFPDGSRSFLQEKEEEKRVVSSVEFENSEGNLVQRISRPIVFAVFCIAVGFFPIGRFQVPAIAAPAASDVMWKTKERGKVLEETKELKSKDHEYSDCTRRLLEVVSGLLCSIEEVRSGKGDIKKIEAALKEVKLKKEELQEEIMTELYNELRELKREKDGLSDRSEEIVDMVVKAKREHERLLGKASGGGKEIKEQIARLEENMNQLNEEYAKIWERIGEIEDQILRRDTMALSIGVRELSFITRECEQLVQRFRQEMKLGMINR